MTQTNETAVERPADVVARCHYEWGIGRGNDFSFDEAPKGVRDRCYHAADATLRALAALSPSPAENGSDGIREAALEEAARVVDGLIDTYRSSGVDECLDDIGSLRLARDKIRALKSTKDEDTHE